VDNAGAAAGVGVGVGVGVKLVEGPELLLQPEIAAPTVKTSKKPIADLSGHDFVISNTLISTLVPLVTARLLFIADVFAHSLS
jgi:hypothetical protein